MDLKQLWLIAALPALVVVSGCQSTIRYLSEGTTYGDIAVSKPRVSTRERLINDRAEEEVWLKAQLRETDNKEFGVQGKSDIRTFTGVSARAGVQADAKVVALTREAKDQDLEDAQRQRELKALDFQIALKKKQKELVDATADASKAASAYYPGKAVEPGKSAETPKVDERAGTALESFSKKLEEFNKQLVTLAGRESGKVAEPVTASVRASPIDEFRDRLAYREEVRSELLQNALDDAHDLARNTLHRLSFDTTILPGMDTSAWAVVGVKLNASKDGFPDAEEFARIVNQRIQREASDYGAAVLEQCQNNAGNAELRACLRRMRPEALARLMDFAAEVSKQLPANLEKTALEEKLKTYSFSFESFRSSSMVQRVPVAPRTPGRPVLTDGDLDVLITNLHGNGGGVRGDSPSGRSLALGAHASMLEGLTLKLAGGPDFNVTEREHSVRGRENFCLVNPEKRLPGFLISQNAQGRPQRIAVGMDSIARVSVWRELGNARVTTRDGWIGEDTRLSVRGCDKGFLEKVKNAVEAVETDLRQKRIHAYGATPKETVQRVSEVLSRREANEFALALQALTGAASIDTMFNYIRVNDALFHALRRQPLVVGYSGPLGPMGQQDGASLGWIIGPRFEIRAEGKDQSAGFRHVPIQNTVTGIVSVPAFLKSVEVTVTKCWRDSKEPWGVVANLPIPCNSETHTVRLPNDPWRAFSLYEESGKRQISVSPVSPGDYSVREGEPASLLIRGENLWRNTTVLLGAQEAERVTVLPDMGGILAHFPRVKSGWGRRVNGQVQTELGIATSEDFVPVARVVIEAAEAERGTSWSLEGLRLVYPESELTVRAVPRLPDGFNELTMRLVNEDKRLDPVAVSGDLEVFNVNQAVKAKAPAAASFKNWADGNTVAVSLLVKRFPKDNSPGVQALPNVVYYTEKSKSEASYKIVKKSDTQHTAELLLPVRFADSYPVMGRLSAIPVTIQWYPKDKPNEKQTERRSCTPGIKRTCTFTIGVPKEATLSIVTLGDGVESGYPPVRIEP